MKNKFTKLCIAAVLVSSISIPTVSAESGYNYVRDEPGFWSGTILNYRSKHPNTKQSKLDFCIDRSSSSSTIVNLSYLVYHVTPFVEWIPLFLALGNYELMVSRAREANEDCNDLMLRFIPDINDQQ